MRLGAIMIESNHRTSRSAWRGSGEQHVGNSFGHTSNRSSSREGASWAAGEAKQRGTARILRLAYSCVGAAADRGCTAGADGQEEAEQPADAEREGRLTKRRARAWRWQDTFGIFLSVANFLQLGVSWSYRLIWPSTRVIPDHGCIIQYVNFKLFWIIKFWIIKTKHYCTSTLVRDCLQN